MQMEAGPAESDDPARGSRARFESLTRRWPLPQGQLWSGLGPRTDSSKPAQVTHQIRKNMLLRTSAAQRTERLASTASLNAPSGEVLV